MQRQKIICNKLINRIPDDRDVIGNYSNFVMYPQSEYDPKRYILDYIDESDENFAPYSLNIDGYALATKNEDGSISLKEKEPNAEGRSIKC